MGGWQNRVDQAGSDVIHVPGHGDARGDCGSGAEVLDVMCDGRDGVEYRVLEQAPLLGIDPLGVAAAKARLRASASSMLAAPGWPGLASSNPVARPIVEPAVARVASCLLMVLCLLSLEVGSAVRWDRGGRAECLCLRRVVGPDRRLGG